MRCSLGRAEQLSAAFSEGMSLMMVDTTTPDLAWRGQNGAVRPLAAPNTKKSVAAGLEDHQIIWQLVKEVKLWLAVNIMVLASR